MTVRTAPDGSILSAKTPVHGLGETIGGWFILDVADRDEAVAIAKAPADSETIEIRPVLESA